jgi:hypothetical protein
VQLNQLGHSHGLGNITLRAIPSSESLLENYWTRIFILASVHAIRRLATYILE